MKVKVNKENYQREVLDCQLPVLVEFYAKWCSKCAMMEDVVEEIAETYAGIFKVCQIEIEESSQLAGRFDVGIVPTFVVFIKMMEDVVEEIAETYAGIFKVCQIEIEESSQLAGRFDVGIVPTFVVFINGKAVLSASGLLNRETLVQMVLSKIQ